ncbi:phage tail domain-containing protein [Youngiibacter fragilis]|uniref:Phage tail protein n=1 Tax=Youngiibacter fragilis 232.1 TaxID=994573 RepID=V7IAB8_9CLOT|nr:phage tail domain-containing protein [Youngiibacter fragilis]ETA82289.1 hypothetical protein T472_0201815 [Youngiibacter fragilis 232.1]
MDRELWLFNGMTLSNHSKWDVEEVIEGIGIPKVRGSNLQVPFQHGTRWVKKRYDRRKMVFSMWIKGKDRSELDQNIDTFIRGVAKPGIHTLRRIGKNGEVREAQGELSSDINFVRKAPGYAKFALEIELPDPFFYGADEVIINETIGARTHNWIHEYMGTAPLISMEIKLVGPMTNPMLQNTNNGIWVQYLGVINTGESVVLNTRDFSCIKEGENVITTVKHGGDAYWMVFESGTNNLKLTTETTGGTVEFRYHPSYF